MTNLRKAAEELIKEWDWECGEYQNKALTELIEALRQALAQPEQEQYVTKVVAMHEDGTYTTERIPLPKREWIGLTDEEILEEYRQCYGGEGTLTNCYFAKAIIKKFKEKNT